MEERATYLEIRTGLFDCQYLYCKGKLFSHGDWQQGEHEMNFAYDEYESAFDSTIEKVMLEVLTLILLSGRLPEADQYHREKFRELIKSRQLNELLIEVPEDEKQEFLHDVKILNLLPVSQ